MNVSESTSAPPLVDWGKRWLDEQASQAQRHARSAPRARGFNGRTHQLYLERWQAFCEFLTKEGLVASQVDQPVVERFALSCRVLAVNQPNLPSAVTQARYIKLIQNILRYAQLNDWYEPHAHPLVAPPERIHHNQSVVITPMLLAKVRQQIQPCPPTFKECRDSLVLHLICYEALTVQELRSLRWDQVEHDSSGWTTHLHMSGTRPAHSRILTLKPAATALIEQWRQLLDGLPAGELVLRGMPTRPSITGVKIYQICTQALRSALAGIERDQWPYHLGPNTLRNACLTEWLAQGMARQEVARRAALSRTDPLDRLDHWFLR